MSTKNIISLSGGKDSTCLLLMMLEREEPIHSVVFFDTGWEFPQIYDHIDKLEQYVGFKFVRLNPKTAFDFLLLRYGWPDAIRRWCTREKINAVKQFAKKSNGIECIGYAIDEPKRKIIDRNVRLPLKEFNVTEKQALEYCWSKGFDWNGLYEDFNRVSCFCYPLKGSPAKWKMMRKKYPNIWDKMLKMDNFERNRGFYGYKTVHDLDARFRAKEAQKRLPGIEIK